MNKIIYLAGPMTGYPDYNYPAFAEAGEQLLRLGATVINPADNFGGNQSLPWHVYIGRAISQVLTADQVRFLPNWETSTGAQIEHLVASAMQIELLTIDGREVPREREHLEEALSLVQGNRQDDYGNPFDNFTAHAEIAEAMGMPRLTPQQIAMHMMACKISRQIHRPKRDNLVDLAGYVLTYRECLRLQK